VYTYTSLDRPNKIFDISFLLQNHALGFLEGVGRMATYPGIHPEFMMDRYSEKNRRVILEIAKNFYVTRSFQALEIGNARYDACLARPSDEFSVAVNATRELLFLFADYPNFEIRTLDGFDKFYSSLEPARIDRSIRFLVTQDENASAKIQHYLSQNPEYPIIIPLTYDKFSGPGANPLLDATRKNFLLRDLFGFQNPLKEDTFFFGRQKLVTEILDRAKAGQHSSIFGLRKSGKTSTVYALTRKAKALEILPLLIDCQDPRIHARSYAELLTHICEIAWAAAGYTKKLEVFSGKPFEISQIFTTNMQNILSHISKKLLLIFDEIENISPGTAASLNWREKEDPLLFWQILRSFIQNQKQSRLSLCIVGTNSQLLELEKICGSANPVYLFAQKQFIPNLSFDETKEMVTRLGHFMGLRFDDAIINDLNQEFGGHPFLIRQVCSRLHQISDTARPIDVTRANLAAAKRDYENQLVSYFSDVLRHLREFYPAEFDLLHEFCQGREEDLRSFSSEAENYIDHLLGYGLIIRRGEEIDIKLASIRRALNYAFRSSSPTQEDKWSEISRRRNEIEINIRVALYHWSLNLGDNEWNEFLKENMTKDRFQKLPTTEKIGLFSRKSSPLYLSDLMMFLKNDRCLPHFAERRRQIVQNLDIINRLRVDAHARSLSDQEMANVRASFDFIEALFVSL
jgi:hypothetical protein